MANGKPEPLIFLKLSSIVLFSFDDLIGSSVIGIKNAQSALLSYISNTTVVLQQKSTSRDTDLYRIKPQCKMNITFQSKSKQTEILKELLSNTHPRPS